MKKRLTVCLCFLLMTFLQVESHAQKKLIHYWHFNNTLPAGGGGGVHYGTAPLPADYSTLSNAGIVYKAIPGTLKDTGYVDNVAGDTINVRMGQPAGSGWRARNPSDSMELLWFIPTTHYQNIVITYETEASSTASGQHRQVYSYSLDNGQTYSTTGLPVAFDSAGTTWGKVKLDLSSLTAVNNKDQLVLKIVFTAPNTGASGNNRFDNITVEGDTLISLPTAVTESTTVNGYNVFPNPSNDYITVVSPIEEAQQVVISNAMGQVLYTSEQDSKQYILSVADLKNGMYLLSITNSQGKTVVPFVKN